MTVVATIDTEVRRACLDSIDDGLALCSATGMVSPQVGSSSINKSDLIKRLAATHPDLLPGDVSRVVGTILGEIAMALSQGRRVELRGFGSFDVRQRRSRVGRDPRTGVAVKVPAKAALHFKSGKDLRDHLNEDADAKRPHSAQRGPAQ